MNEIPPSNSPAAVPPIPGQTAPNTNQLLQFENGKKSAGIALFLCWVLGIFGAHRFYLNRPHAVTMLVITLISFPLCFVVIGFAGIVATWAWMIIDLFSISRWAKEHNTALLAKITSGQGL